MKKTITILTILFYQLSYSQTYNVETILNSGPAEERINIVILGDGYQSHELEQFKSDAVSFSDALFQETPYKQYKNYFNVFAIEVPSNESGASHPGTATDVSEPAHPVSNVDNYFGSTFDYFDIHRLLVALKTTKITSVLADNFPLYDQVVILVNSPYYGGSGGQFAISSVHTSAKEIAIHELGHSFVGLKDEYYAGDVYASEGINMTRQTNPIHVKWKNWMGDNGIGIYQHCCGGSSANWYRPHQSCKMRYLSSPFCAICIEGTIEKIHTLVNPIDSYSPHDGNTIKLTDPLTFSATFIKPAPNTLSTSWTLNGLILKNNVDSVTLNPDDLTRISNQLTLKVEDNSSMLRIDQHQSIHFQRVTWTLSSTLLSIEDVSEDYWSIKLFPNPTSNALSIAVKSEKNQQFTIKIFDTLGRQYITDKVTSNIEVKDIDISQIPSGNYIINFYLKDQLAISRKIIKN